jgi:hypothetical protein
MPTSIRFDQFHGIIPKLDDKKLPKGFAATATNCEFESGAIKSIKSDSLIDSWASSSAYKTLYKYGTQWLVSTAVYNICKPAMVPTTDYNKRVFTKTGQSWVGQFNSSQWTESRGEPSTLSTTEALSEYSRLGIPDFSFNEYGQEIGLNPPLIEYSSGAGGNPNNTTDGQYVGFTVVVEHADGTQEESVIIGSLKRPIYVDEGDYIMWKDFVDASWSWPDFDDTGYEIKYLRFYRLVAGEEGAQWRQHQVYHQEDGGDPYADSGGTQTGPYWDLPIALVSTPDDDYVFDWNGGNTGNQDVCSYNTTYGPVLTTENFYEPPTDMQGITNFQNGMLVGFSGSELCVSEPFYQYAWPEDYKLQFPEDIVGIAVFNASIVVATESQIWVVTGSEPIYLSQTQLPISQGCISSEGMISTRFGVVVPTPDGLFLVNESDGMNITKDVWSKEQWEALDTDNSVGAFYDNKYYLFFRGDTDAYILNFADNSVQSNLQKFELSENFRAVYVDDSTDSLYILTSDGTTAYIRTFATLSSAYRNIEYKTARVEVPVPCAYPWLRIIGEQDSVNPLAYTVYGDGVSLATGSITSNNSVRLPAATRAKDWQVKYTQDDISEDNIVLSYNSSQDDLSFSGSDSFDTLATLKSTMASNFTVAFSLKPTDGQPASNQGIFGSWQSPNDGFVIYLSTDGRPGLKWYTGGSDALDISPPVIWDDDAASVYTDVAWVFDFDNLLLYLYYDGVIQSGYESGFDLSGIATEWAAYNPAATAYVGDSHGGTYAGLTGSMEYLKVYSSALSSTLITELTESKGTPIQVGVYSIELLTTER